MRVLMLTVLLLMHPPSNAQAASDLVCEPARGEMLGTVLVLHGLNQDPQTMDPLCRELAARGLTACRLTLAGHSPDTPKHNATKQRWIAQLESAYAEIEARFPNQPRYLLAYSIGASVAVTAILKNEDLSFAKMFFIAPAIVLNWRSTFLRPLLPLRVLNFSLPSLAPKGYRVHSSTSLDAYHAAVSLADSLRSVDPSRLRSIPTTIFISKDDEIVSARGFEKWRRRHNVEAWQIEFVEPKPTPERSFAHMLFDEPTAGSMLWHRLLTALERHFDLPSR